MAAADGRICRHLHLPLQSGSSRVLAEMNRPYDAAFFADLVKRLRSAMPSFALSTDIIVGFPGETEDDFAQTVELAREVRFGKIHVFRYSKREGTPAAQRPDQVDPDVIARRSHELQELGLMLAHEDARSRIGTEELVLVERTGMGTTESYHPVRWRPGTIPPAIGELTPVRMNDMTAEGAFLV